MKPAKILRRRPEWKQANPRDQLVSVLNAARGIASNIQENRYPVIRIVRGRNTHFGVEDAAKELDDLLEQCVELSQMDRWPADVDKQEARAARRLNSLAVHLGKIGINSAMVQGKMVTSKGWHVEYVKNQYVIYDSKIGWGTQYRKDLAGAVFFIDRHKPTK